MRRRTLPDVVGETEIAVRLSVQANTVHVWRKRGLLPPPDGRASGVPWWLWATIEPWAIATGRVSATNV